MALTDNLALALLLNESSGNAVDALGSNDFTQTGSISSTTGVFGNCRVLDGIEDSKYFSHADNSTLSFGDIDFAICFWAYYASFPAGFRIFVKGTASDPEIQCRYSGGDGIRFEVWSASGATGVHEAAEDSAGFPSTATWYWYFMCHDSSANQIRMYRNNVLTQQTAHSAGVWDGSGQFNIGTGIIGQQRTFNGRLQQFLVWKNKIPDSTERAEIYNSGSGKAWPWSAASYTLAADYGLFTLTGQSASLLAARTLTADYGTFAITGQAANLLAARILTAAQGAFTLTGQDAALLAARTLTADVGSFTLTGQDAALVAFRILAAGYGSFAVAGQDALLQAARRLIASHGTITITGQDVTLTYSGGSVVIPGALTVADAFRIKARRKRMRMVSG